MDVASKQQDARGEALFQGLSTSLLGALSAAQTLPTPWGQSFSITRWKCACLLHDARTPEEHHEGQHNVHSSEDEALVLLLKLMHCTSCHWW